MALIHGREFGEKIAEVFGIDIKSNRVRRIEITADVREAGMIIVTQEIFATEEQAEQIVEIISTYELKEKQ